MLYPLNTFESGASSKFTSIPLNPLFPNGIGEPELNRPVLNGIEKFTSLLIPLAPLKDLDADAGFAIEFVASKSDWECVTGITDARYLP